MKNLLCVAIAGCVLTLGAAGADAHHMKGEKETAIIRASYALPKKDGEEFRRTMREADSENAQLAQQIAADHVALYDLLTSEDFDRKAFLARAKELRTLQEQTKENRDDAFAAAAEQLTSEERVTLAHALENQPAHKHMHQHKHAASGNQQNARSETPNKIPPD